MTGSGIVLQPKESGTRVIVPIELEIVLENPALQKSDSVEISYVVGASNGFALCVGGDSSKIIIKANLISVNEEDGSLSVYLRFMEPPYLSNTFFRDRIRRARFSPYNLVRKVESL